MVVGRGSRPWGPSFRIHDRVVAGLDVDFLAARTDPLVLRGLKLAASQLRPELFVVTALAVGVFEEHAVVATLDLVEGVPQRAAGCPRPAPRAAVAVSFMFRAFAEQPACLGKCRNHVMLACWASRQT